MSFVSNVRPSPQEYFRASHLLSRVEEAMNGCYAAQPENPLRFVADRLRDGCQSAALRSLSCSIRLDGALGYALSIQAELSDGTAQTVLVRLSNAPLHPASVRRTVSFSTAPADAAARTAVLDSCSSVFAQVVIVNALDQRSADNALEVADGTKNFAVIGSAAAAAASLCVLGAAADLCRQQAFVRLSSMGNQGAKLSVPLPVVTLLSSGEMKQFGKLRVSEICFIPSVDAGVQNALLQASRVLEELQRSLDDTFIYADGGIRLPVGIDSLASILDTVEEAMREAGLNPGHDGFLGVVCDSSWCFKSESQRYNFSDSLPDISGAQLAETLSTLCREKKSVTYLEDPLHAADKNEARRLMSRVGSSVSICMQQNVGGDATSAMSSTANAELNTIGARLEDCGSVTNVSSLLRSATADAGRASALIAGAIASPIVADVAVGCGVRYLRAGGLARGNGAHIYNRLADIESHLEATGCKAPLNSQPHSRCELPPPPAEPVVDVQPTKDKKKK